MDVIKYVKSLRSERTALYGRLHVVERQLEAITSALSEDAPPPTAPRVARHAATLKRKRHRAGPTEPDVEAAILDVLSLHEPTTRAVINEIVGRDCAACLVGLLREGRIARRAWRLHGLTTRPPYYYARTAPVLDRMEDELMESGQIDTRPSNPATDTPAATAGTGVVAGTTGAATSTISDRQTISAS